MPRCKIIETIPYIRHSLFTKCITITDTWGPGVRYSQQRQKSCKLLMQFEYTPLGRPSRSHLSQQDSIVWFHEQHNSKKPFKQDTQCMLPTIPGLPLYSSTMSYTQEKLTPKCSLALDYCTHKWTSTENWSTSLQETCLEHSTVYVVAVWAYFWSTDVKLGLEQLVLPFSLTANRSLLTKQADSPLPRLTLPNAITALLLWS